MLCLGGRFSHCSIKARKIAMWKLEYPLDPSNTLIIRRLVSPHRIPNKGRGVYRFDVRHVVPEALERICLRSLRKRPDERYQRADEVAANLRDYLAR
jgi:hypothetical protein